MIIEHVRSEVPLNRFDVDCMRAAANNQSARVVRVSLFERRAGCCRLQMHGAARRLFHVASTLRPLSAAGGLVGGFAALSMSAPAHAAPAAAPPSALSPDEFRSFKLGKVEARAARRLQLRLFGQEAAVGASPLCGATRRALRCLHTLPQLALMAAAWRARAACCAPCVLERLAHVEHLMLQKTQALLTLCHSAFRTTRPCTDSCCLTRRRV